MEGKRLLWRNRASEITKSGDLANSRKEENLLAELEGFMTSAEFNILLETYEVKWARMDPRKKLDRPNIIVKMG